MNPERYIATEKTLGFYKQFRKEEDAMNYGTASEIFMEALHDDPVNAYRYFTCETGGVVSGCINRTGRAAEVVAFLDRAFESHPNINLMYYGKPELVEYFSRLREENIEKGLPPAVIVTQGKSGSVSIANFFTSGLNMPSYAYSFVSRQVVPSWARDYARGGACYVTHLDPSLENVEALKAAGIHKMIVHTRDPRQGLVSLAHHITNYDFSQRELKRQGFLDKSFNEQLWEIRHKYIKTLWWIESWYKLREHIDIQFSTFEQFIDDKEKMMSDYLDFFDVDPCLFDREKATSWHEGTDYHFRKGAKEEWREVIPQKYQLWLNNLLSPELCSFFGWPEK